MRLVIALVCAACGLRAAASTLAQQPVIWEDLADLDVFRVNNTWYYSASTMHYSPGAPLLESKDLINWQYVSHSVPVLEFGAAYSLPSSSHAYSKGVYASSARQRPSDGKFYWVGCVEYSRSYIYSAPSAAGPWTKLVEFPNICFYDCGLLFDDDGTPYIAHGVGDINVAKLSSDLKTQVSDTNVYKYGNGVEGSRMYKIKNSYYILNDNPSTNYEYVLKGSSPTGPYTSAVLSSAPACANTGAGSAHQGGIVDDMAGNWYYMAFCNAYPGGRVPVLAPIQFNSQGFPQLSASSFPNTVTTPMTSDVKQARSYSDKFTASRLGETWEWNHNPDTTAFSTGRGLVLKTATITDNFYQARNTLTHRILGPKSTTRITLDYSGMKAGDRAGLVALRDSSAWIGVVDDGSAKKVVLWTGLALTQQGGQKWTATNLGKQDAASSSLPASGSVQLQAVIDVSSRGSKEVQFGYSTNGGSSFTNLGRAFTMTTGWEFYLGYRVGIFNFATKALGGSVTVTDFSMTM